MGSEQQPSDFCSGTEKKMDNLSALREYWPYKLLPLPRYNGARLFALASISGGTGKTYLACEFIKEFSKSIGDKKALVIDLSFTGDLRALLERIPEKGRRKSELAFQTENNENTSKKDYADLGSLLCKIDEPQSGEKITSPSKLTHYVTHYSDKVDVILSSRSKFYNNHWDSLFFTQGMISLISEMQDKYSIILLDTPSDMMHSMKAIFSMVNFVLVPYPLSRGTHPLGGLKQLDQFVGQLMVEGCPIDLCKIIPIFDDCRVSNKSRRVLEVLKELFGKAVWPVVPGNSQWLETTQKMFSQISKVGYQAVIDEMLSLLIGWPNNSRKPTLDGSRLIMKCVWELDEDLSREEIAEKIRVEFICSQNEVSRYKVGRYSKKFSIFGYKSYKGFKNKIRKAFLGEHLLMPPIVPSTTHLSDWLKDDSDESELPDNCGCSESIKL